MKIAVRLDDITPDMDWERFYRFKELLDRYQVKPLIGVVPDNRDPNLARWPAKSENGKKETVREGTETPPDFWEYIKALEREGWVIAMHGCHHVYSTGRGGIFPLNDFSEFAGLPLERQGELLAEGKRFLERKGISTRIFMAPAHSYDNNTLRALKENGFEALTDGFGSCPYRWKGLDFYPISFMLSRTLQGKRGYSTMVVHTNTVTDEDLRRYEENFERKDIAWIPFGEYLRVEKRKRTVLGRWKEFLMARAKFLLVRAR